MGVDQRKDLIQQIEKKRGSRLLCCLTSDRDGLQGAIAKDFLFRFFLHLREMPKLEKLDVLLFTLGGDTLAAYALSRLVRQYAKQVNVLVPHYCLSSGTLFALGADEIVMTRLGTLSAIDPSINTPLNPTTEVPTQPGLPAQKITIPVGVENVAGFKKLVTEEWRLEEQGISRAFSLLAEKVNPVVLGNLQRSKEQIVQLATSLMQQHIAPMDSKKVEEIATRLASGLGSHDYLIVASEARKDVQLPVPELDVELEAAILKLYEDFAVEMELGTPFNPLEKLWQSEPGKPPQAATSLTKVVMIESLVRSDAWEREIVIVPPGQMQVRRNHWRK